MINPNIIATTQVLSFPSGSSNHLVSRTIRLYTKHSKDGGSKQVVRQSLTKDQHQQSGHASPKMIGPSLSIGDDAEASTGLVDVDEVRADHHPNYYILSDVGDRIQELHQLIEVLGC
jgi:hypothetical protein